MTTQKQNSMQIPQIILYEDKAWIDLNDSYASNLAGYTQRIIDEYYRIGVSAPFLLNDLAFLMRKDCDVESFVRRKMKDSITEEVEIAGLRMDKNKLVNSAQLPEITSFAIAIGELANFIEYLKLQYSYDYKKKQIIGSTECLILEDRKVTINNSYLKSYNDDNGRRIIKSKSQEEVYEIVNRIAESLNELVTVSKDFSGRPLKNHEVNFHNPGFIFNYHSILEYDSSAKKFKAGVNFVLAN